VGTKRQNGKCPQVSIKCVYEKKISLMYEQYRSKVSPDVPSQSE